MSNYSAHVLADSVSPDGVRLTTLEVTFPRFILAEFNTHRVFSRNSASSRAIPPEQNIKNVEENMFVPETLGSRVKGMGYGLGLTDADLEAGLETWRRAGTDAAIHAAQMNHLGVDKSRVNRLLEPFMWHTVIVSSTEWGNYYGLRAPVEGGPVPDFQFPAQPEIQIVSDLMRKAYQASTPEEVFDGWHTPLVSLDEAAEIIRENDLKIGIPAARILTAEVSSGRCARVSYDTQHNSESADASRARHVGLSANAHWSPAEHPARPLTIADLYDPVLEDKILIPAGHAQEIWGGKAKPDPSKIWCGNYRGWVQLRKLSEHEHDRSVWSKDEVIA